MKRTLNRKEMPVETRLTSHEDRAGSLRALTPQQKVKLAATRAASDIFAIELELRAVRQHRAVAESQLEFIDYAVPCHQLAKMLALDSSAVANRIAAALKSGVYELSGFGIEAISGYVNFQVPTSMIADAMQATSNWLMASRNVSPDAYADRFIVLDSLIEGAQERALTEKVLGYLNHIYSSFGKRCWIYSLVGDSSESALERIARPLDLALRSADQPLSRLQLRRQIVLAQLGTIDADQQSSSAQLRAMGAHRPLAATDLSHNLVFESDIAASVQDYLDRQASGPGLFRDPSSRAVYFDDGEISIALRSSEGFLYSFAYALYTLDSLVGKDMSTPTVVLAPARLQPTITALFSSICNKRGDPQFAYFDPQTSKADVMEIDSEISSIEKYFSTLAESLKATKPHLLQSARTRQAILEIIDTPSELNVLADMRQLPALFDSVNQSIHARITLGHQA